MENTNKLSPYTVYNSWLHTQNTAFSINIWDRISNEFGLIHTVCRMNCRKLNLWFLSTSKNFCKTINFCTEFLHCKHYFHGEADIRIGHWHSLPPPHPPASLPNYQVYAAVTLFTNEKQESCSLLYTGWQKSKGTEQEAMRPNSESNT